MGGSETFAKISMLPALMECSPPQDPPLRTSPLPVRGRTNREMYPARVFGGFYRRHLRVYLSLPDDAVVRSDRAKAQSIFICPLEKPRFETLICIVDHSAAKRTIYHFNVRNVQLFNRFLRSLSSLHY